MRSSLFAATLQARLDGAADALTIPLRADSTIAPERSRPDEPGREAVAMLQRAGAEDGGLSMMETLGAGGMGIVRAARQLRLGRDVAVKSLREDVVDELATLTLLREAWVTGTLEHPNIVPVHDVSVDPQGRPRIVLKRIAGSPWSTFIGRDDLVRARFAARDPLEWHLRVLLQVANAVQFAHSRSILHRDIKPENVMIGSFGEVYLLDWGIAVSLVDDRTGRLPLARDATELAGTPVYMAPEMVCGEPGRLSEQTDVYLLGAVLFEILVGRPPHQGSNLREIIACIVMQSPPTLPAACPPELARIVTTAMALEPVDRFLGVEAFRAALTSYLEHRGSTSVAEEAAARARALEAAFADAAERPPAELRVELYRIFSEARFGFAAALRTWPENDEAQRGLRAAVESMARFELGAGDPGAASALLAELDEPDPELRARVDAACDERTRAEKRRQRLEADIDPATGQRTRLLIGGLLGMLWTASPLATWLLARWDVRHRSLDDAVISSAIMIVLALAIAWWARATMQRTVVNRRMRDATAIVLVGQLALYLGARRMELEMNEVEAIKLLLFGAGSAHIAASVEPAFWWPTAAYLVGFTVGVAFPQSAHLAEACGTAVLTVTILVIWGHRRAQEVGIHRGVRLEPRER